MFYRSVFDRNRACILITVSFGSHLGGLQLYFGFTALFWVSLTSLLRLSLTGIGRASCSTSLFGLFQAFYRSLFGGLYVSFRPELIWPVIACLNFLFLFFFSFSFSLYATGRSSSGQ